LPKFSGYNINKKKKHFDYNMYSLKFRFSDIKNPFDPFITNNKEPILAKIKKYPFLRK